MLSNCARISVLAGLLMVFGPAGPAQGEIVPLGQLDLSKMSSGWGKPLVDKSVTGKTLSIAGRTFDSGVGTHAGSILHVKLDGKTERFRARVGVDDGAGGNGSIRFRLYGDGKKLFDSGLMKGG